MLGSLWSAASGMKAQQVNIDVTSNNLANVNTPGFKKARAEFQDLMYRTASEAGAPVNNGTRTPIGSQIGMGVRAVGVARSFAQGDFLQTENPYDMTIEGEGFFQVQMGDGTVAYTRDGGFKVDSNGTLVTSEGFIVQPNISVPQGARQVTVTPEGVVTAMIGEQAQNLGQIQLVRFVNPAGLTAQGRNLFKPTEASGDPQTFAPGEAGAGTRVMQGALENSNVKVVEEMVNLIVAQRAYEANSKSISTADEMLGQANNLKR
ncbi:MAG TPA: flagellar basal-body rod protein FlgG [Pantanalinema sp.]